ncbi:biotin--[acetyl-CoA-carboxylase] ligase [Curvibacter sp. CHRR-16]|uniref:biotin--[acetyl-CoA-carboxylase] ligase n=1 Tax=Curvibacter sp. CHRR-16 TaxID=2835872 RepID=UPI001BDB41CD|nr:biotin--[acetyl-CoA-carboxylase] ligase [Curvibacter sp. CHRR-16]MBT0570401.1 biotin--[acetyl-CoA-carboxylase] ligase [Curvibacter sp. CHRR-16]
MSAAANAMQLVWPADAIWQAMQPYQDYWPSGVGVEVWPQIDSTNTELMRRARAGQTDAVLIAAEQQTAGRGRLGRQWHTATQAAGSSLTFSLGVTLPLADWSGLSLVTGLLVAQALDPDGAQQVQIKWPNDLWRQGRKLVGILIEAAGSTTQGSAPRYAVIGIGINVVPVQAADLRTPPTAVQDWNPHATAPQLLLQVAPRLVQGLQRFVREGWPAFAADYAQRCCLTGRQVQCSDGLQGMALGVDAQGRLRVQTAQGEVQVHSGEISVRPVQ